MPISVPPPADRSRVVSPADAAQILVQDGDGLSVSFRFSHSAAEPGRLLTAFDAAGGEVLRVVFRQAGRDPALHAWDSIQQNYLESSSPFAVAPAVVVLETTIAIAHGPPYRRSLPTELRLGISTKRIVSGWVTVAIRLRPGKAELLINGVLRDEDWPCGGPARPIARLELGPASGPAKLLPPWSGAAQPELPPGPTTGVIPGSRIQYWTPSGENQWLGDTMMFQDGERLHILYLIDRRHGASKAGCGGHQIAHLSTTDLRSWSTHPLAVELSAPWETCGTGSMVRHDGRWWIIFGLHTDRAVEPAAVVSGGFVDAARHHTAPQVVASLGGPPMGTMLAVSSDGITFTRHGTLVHPAQNPSVFADPAGGFCLFAGYGATGLYRSDDLLHWRAVDHFIIPHGPQAPQRNTTECICHHEWNGWHYLLGGRTGLWMSRAMAGPYWDQDDAVGRQAAAGIRAEAGEHAKHLLNPRPPGTIGHPAWDIYDGLWVPMIAALADGRRILSGWLQGEGEWAGCLVLRELHQEPDGTLALSWPSEVVPPLQSPQPLRWEGEWAHGPTASLGADGQPWLAAASDLPEQCLITVTFSPTPGAGAYGICVLGSGDLQDGCELRLDPLRARAQWSTPSGGRPGAEIPDQQEIFEGPEAGTCIWQMTSPHLASKGRDFSITGVVGLDRPVRLRLLITQHPKDGSVIIDAELNGGAPGSRTLVTRRPAGAGRRLQLFASRGAVRIDALSVQPLLGQ